MKLNVVQTLFAFICIHSSSVFCRVYTFNDNPFNVPVPLSLDTGFVLRSEARVKAGSPLVEIEVFLDLICPDSKNAWETLRTLSMKYNPDIVSINARFFPLPYHRNAYITSKGFHAIKNLAANYSTAYVDAVFNNQRQFFDKATARMDDGAVRELLATITYAATGISKTRFLSDIDGYTGKARYEWKYGARKGVAGTPWYFLNGVDLMVNSSYHLSVEEWISLIDSLL